MYRKFILFSLVLTFCVVLLGAYTRLSDAGLGCPDWPGCYGKLVVPESSEEIARANEAFPERPLESAKAWKEMVHRYLAGVLGLCVLVLAVSAFFRRQDKLVSIVLSLLLFALVIFQALLGMWTVLYKVMPLTVVGHLVAGFFTFYLLFWMYLRTSPDIQPVSDREGIKWFSRIAFVILLAQIILGGWTSSNYAALACPDFPTCFGKWWPNVDYHIGFKIWRGTDLDYEGGLLSMNARAAIHWTHRIGALITFLVLSVLAIKVSGHPQEKGLSKGGVILSMLLFVQIALGMSNVIYQMPMFVAVAHNGVAALLLLAVGYIRFFASWTNVVGGEVISEQPNVGLDEPGTITAPVIDDEAGIIVEKPPESLFDRLRSQLERTRSGLTDVLVNLSLGKKEIDAEVIEEIESSLLIADVGVETTADIITNLKRNIEDRELTDSSGFVTVLRQQLRSVLQPCNQLLTIPESDSPFVILVVGVNGVGKTTTIGKLAKRLQTQGHSVMLAAGDTFRAAAVEQLEIWGERNDIHVVAQHSGADSASVIFDGVQSAKARGIDVLIADTAGRLHTKSNLMEELKKIKRIMGKLDENAPHEVMLVLDAGTGQNALSQTAEFNAAVEVTGIALTKLDGTAKGGVIFALATRFGIPIRFVGVGEGIEDLQDFDAEEFIDALFGDQMGGQQPSDSTRYH